MSLDFIPTTTDDIPWVMQQEQDPANKEYIYPYSQDRHQQVIDSNVEFHFILQQKETSKKIGFIVLALTEKEHDSMEFRRIVITQKGNGYGKACVEWIIDFALETQGCKRLWLDVFPDNHRAQHVYETAGFVREGVKRSCIRGKEKRKDLWVYSIIKQNEQDNHSIHNRIFRLIENVDHGETTSDTVFHYRQTKDVIWATYQGGNIKFGTLSGKMLENGNLHFQYQHENTDGEFKRGTCHSKRTHLSNGKIRFLETWQWTNGQEGQSIVEEI